MTDDGWSNGTCSADPGLPKLLLLSLERVGVRDLPEITFREYDSRGTLRCKVMIFVGRSTLYPEVEPWSVATTGFCFEDTYQKVARKALRRFREVYKRHLRQTPMGFFPPTRGRGRSWISRMRGLGKEEDLEDTVSHLSTYLTGLDKLYQDTAGQLKHQIQRAEKAEQEMEVHRRRARIAQAQAEGRLTALQDLWQKERERFKAHRDEAQLLEGEPEETHWDKSTQTENLELERCLPPKKRYFQIEGESP